MDQLVRNWLVDIPMFHKLAVLTTENVHNRAVGLGGSKMYVHVNEDIIPINEAPYDFNAVPWITLVFSTNKVHDALRPVWNHGFVLNITWVKPLQCAIKFSPDYEPLIEIKDRFPVAL